MNNVFPRTQVPNIQLETVDGVPFDLHHEVALSKNLTVVLFYRGFHCPVCKKQLQDFNENYSKFFDKGMKVFAISADCFEPAKKAKVEWGIGAMPIIYDFPLKNTAEWGLYTSESISEKEPKRFGEQGLFIIKPDRTLYGSTVQTMPFTRPTAKNLLKGLDFAIDKNYPARGEYQEYEHQAIELIKDI